MNIHNRADHKFIGGKSGMGKTSLAIDLVKGTPEDRVFIFDPDNEFATRMKLADFATNWEDFYKLAERERVVCFDPSFLYPGFAAEGFEEFCSVVFQLAQDGFEPKGLSCVMVTDEIQKYVNSAYAPPAFKNILETGRKWNLATISLSRAPNRVNTGIREEFTELCLFRLDDSNSIKFVEGLGINADAVGNLAPHHYFYVNVIKGTSRECVVPFAQKKVGV